MKNRIIIIFLLLSTVSFNLFASTKKVDPWKYEPQRKAGTDLLDIIAERTVEKSILDQVVDNTTIHDVITETEKRRATVQVSTSTAKKAMGNTMMKRIFQNTAKGGLWGALGVTAVQSLLEGIDWVMDPQSQSIWRNKNPDPNACVYCTIKIKINVVSSTKNPFYSIESAEEEVTRVTGFTKENYDFKWEPSYDQQNVLIRLDLTVYLKGSTSSLGKRAYGYVEQPPEVEKEYLTDEALADYMLGTHPDFSNPKYSGKLPAYNTWTSVADAFKPANDYEYDNNPAVQIAKHAIENGTTIRDETGTNTNVTPKPDGAGFDLPAFCTWAKYVCDFVDWVKKDDLPEKDESDLNVTEDFTEKTVNVSWGAQCPQPVYESVTLHGVTAQVKVADYSYICSLDWLIKPFVLGFASISALFILFGFNKGGDD
ncbi:hypothetical protein BAX55_18675 [Acinetobacter baumannii]|uniref:virulence factor TspB C-terminal domain-related protein n=1 Tax=Acinetobacter baumannii TaxID=470 RepID=UPI0007EE3C0A|nr:virulence factor TspB C-terminal domain-related protein [Acinetobacter baumannii]OBS04259.1 hypothetical protein BAX55_18675 [Acinetobacter baumannii]